MKKDKRLDAEARLMALQGELAWVNEQYRTLEGQVVRMVQYQRSLEAQVKAMPRMMTDLQGLIDEIRKAAQPIVAPPFRRL